MTTKLTLGTLRKTTGIPLISAEVEKPGAGKSYKALEKECESKTHREMREYGADYFQRLGYRIFPEAVGIEGVFTFADFLAVRPGRVVFVECLTDKNLKKEVLARKQGLQRFGELCFVVVGGHGCKWAPDEHRIPRVANQLSHSTDVLQFFYGNWQNKWEKRIEKLTPFPTICFNVPAGGRPSVSAMFDFRKTTSDTSLQFVATPYVVEGLTTFVTELAFRAAWLVHEKSRLKTSPRWGFGAGRPKVFKDESNRTVLSVRIVNEQVKITTAGKHGMKVLGRILAQLPSFGIDVRYDKAEYGAAIAKLSARPGNVRVQRVEIIDSSFYAPDAIVLVLVHFFANNPTRVGDFRKHLPGCVSCSVGYWLKRGVQLRVLQRTDETARTLNDRNFIATQKGLDCISQIRVKPLIRKSRVLLPR
jgi:hypothetical protein